jgi:hypothetical protein
VATPLVEAGKPFAGFQGSFCDTRLQGLRHDSQHLRIDRIGLGEEAGHRQDMAQIEIVPSGRLEQHEGVTLRPVVGQLSHGSRCIIAPDGHAGCRIKHIQMMLGDIDSNKAKGYDHGAYPCAARSVAAASINCSGLGRSRARAGDPTRSRSSRPGTERSPARTHPDTAHRHRDPVDTGRAITACSVFTGSRLARPSAA